jgi:FtsH-binding integral membrane protein
MLIAEKFMSFCSEFMVNIFVYKDKSAPMMSLNMYIKFINLIYS